MPAQIPDSFVPSATTNPLGVSPMSGQPVQPMQNAAPGQQEQSGAAVQRLGMETNDIGERIQNQLDDAMAKTAETAFLRNAMTIMNGDGKDQPGYLHTRGVDAQNGYADATEALAKVKQQALDGLGSDFQKAMFNRVANQHLLSFGTQAADHRFQQVSEYAVQASLDRANTYATKMATSWSTYGQKDAAGNPTGDYYNAQQAAVEETINAAQVGKGTPRGSDMSNAAVLLTNSLGAQGALMQAMDAKAPYSKVQQMYDDMKTNGLLTLQAIDSMGRAVNSYVEQRSGRTFIEQDLSDAQRASQGLPTSSTGTPDYHYAIKGAAITSSAYDKDAGGVEVQIPANTPVQAPAGGIVISAGPDENGVGSMQIQHPNGSVTRFTGLNAFNAKVGDTVQSGEDVATSGSSGNQKNPSVFWSLQDANHNPVDPTRAGLPPVDLTKITDENTLHAALDKLPSQIPDPKALDQAREEMENIVKVNQRNANAQKAQILQQATDAFYTYANKHGGTYSMSAISPALQSQIPPEALSRFKDIATNGSTQDNVNTVAGFILHPETLTVANVQAARPQLSNARYLSLLGDAQSMQSQPAKVRAVTLDKEQLDASLVNNPGFKTLVDPERGSDDFVNSINLRTSIRDQIDAEQVRTGKELDREAKQKIIDTTIMNTVSVPGVIGSKQIPAFEMTPKQMQKAFVTVGHQKIALASIPMNVRAGIIQRRQARGLPNTELGIATDWVGAGMPGSNRRSAGNVAVQDAPADQVPPGVLP